jgi:hypothetical protein
MFERFRDSLVYPKRIIQYRKDKLIKVFGYMLLFAILMSAAVTVSIFRFERIPSNVRDLYQDNLTSDVIPCEVINQTFGCITGVNFKGLFYDDGLIVMGVSEDPSISDYSILNVSFIFGPNNVHVYYSAMEFVLDYKDLPSEFSNIDFSLIQSDPDAFTDQMMDGVGEYLISIKSVVAPIIIGSSIFGNIIMILFVVLMNSTILKMRFKIIPFRETFKMGAYLGTTLYILLILNGFFGLGYFTIFLFLILTFRQTNQISLEIMKHIKK